MSVLKFIRLLFYVIFFTAIAAASATVSYRVLSYGEETKVPNLVGQTLTDAKNIAQALNLHIKVDGSEYHNEIPVGFVSRQKMAPGTDVKEGQIIGIVLSKGPKSALMPDFIGRSLDDVRFLVVERGLEMRRISHTHHKSVPAGIVITQNPLPGRKGASVISLLVSLGPNKTYVDVPMLVGLEHEKATEQAQKVGLMLRYTGFGTSVSSQSPKAGSRILKGEIVEVELGEAKN